MTFEHKRLCLCCAGSISRPYKNRLFSPMLSRSAVTMPNIGNLNHSTSATIPLVHRPSRQIVQSSVSAGLNAARCWKLARQPDLQPQLHEFVVHLFLLKPNRTSLEPGCRDPGLLITEIPNHANQWRPIYVSAEPLIFSLTCVSLFFCLICPPYTHTPVKTKVAGSRP